jgi:hypothetical protein
VTPHTLHTIWIYWPEDDAIELHGALDTHAWDVNPDLYQEMLIDAGAKVGPENVRQVKVEVPWDAIVAAFEPPKVEGTVQR